MKTRICRSGPLVVALYWLLLSAWVITSEALAETNPGALVLVNSLSSDYTDFGQLLQPYLIQFGVPCVIHDLAGGPPDVNYGDFSLPNYRPPGT